MTHLTHFDNNLRHGVCKSVDKCDGMYYYQQTVRFKVSVMEENKTTTSVKAKSDNDNFRDFLTAVILGVCAAIFIFVAIVVFFF
jgi:hypothetical protein